MAPSRREFVHFSGLAAAAFAAPLVVLAENGRARQLLVRSGNFQNFRSSSRSPQSDKMKLPRRAFLHLAAGAATLPAISRIAWAEAYPTRPVHVVDGFSAGGGVDSIARLTGQWLSELFGQQFIVVNRPGADSNI